jgi:hypothetical protein
VSLRGLDNLAGSLSPKLISPMQSVPCLDDCLNLCSNTELPSLPMTSCPFLILLGFFHCFIGVACNSLAAVCCPPLSTQRPLRIGSLLTSELFQSCHAVSMVITEREYSQTCQEPALCAYSLRRHSFIDVYVYVYIYIRMTLRNPKQC